MSGFWLQNIAAYSIQIAILLAAGAIAIQLLLARMPAWRLVCWQLLLAVCLLLPVLQSWKPVDDDTSVQFSSRPRAVKKAPPQPAPTRIPVVEIGAGILAAGIVVRLALFSLGLLRLRAYRRRSQPKPELARNLAAQLGVTAQIAASDEIPGPVTFGFLRPVILLPSRWTGNDSVLYHELVHVRRRDWLFMALEEFVRALLWFHPLIWYAIGQIQLAREEVVDREVIKLTQSREQYLETLLAIAATRSGLDLAPAPLFLRKRHLRKRVASLMKEVKMSRIRLNSSLAGFLALSMVAGWFAVRAFPLQAAGQESQSPKRIKVGGNVQSTKLIKKLTPKYPPAAKQARIQGVVQLSVLIGADGKVKNIDLIEGDDELAQAAIEAVWQWEYETTLLNGEPVEVLTQVNVNFTLRE